MTTTVIVKPIVANIMNAALCGLMSFGLLMTPQKFMQGGQYQMPWFNNLPEERNNRLYYIAQFMGFVMMCGCVIPTFLDPSSQFLTYQMAIVFGINIIHTLIFLCTPAYKNAVPTTRGSKSQWYFMTLLSTGFFIVTLLACLHETPDVIDSRATHISKSAANTAMLAFSSVFGVLFTIIPRYLLSTFWTDGTLEPQNKFMGFELLQMSDLEMWWARNIGTAIIGLNLGMAVDQNIDQPLYTAGSLAVVSCLTLFNFHQLMMRPYKAISVRQIQLSWIPNLIMSAGMIAVLVAANLYK
jgi:hypothetical protein